MTSLLPCFKVKVKGRAQGHDSRSHFWRAAVDIRGSALPSAAKSEEESLPVQSVCLCVCNEWACADNRADAVDRLLIPYETSNVHKFFFRMHRRQIASCYLPTCQVNKFNFYFKLCYYLYGLSTFQTPFHYDLLS